MMEDKTRTWSETAVEVVVHVVAVGQRAQSNRVASFPLRYRPMPDFMAIDITVEYKFTVQISVVV